MLKILQIIALLSLATLAYATDNSSSKQQQFIAFMLPKIEAVNTRILTQRQFVETMESTIKAGKSLSQKDKRKLETISSQYKINDFNPDNAKHWQQLKYRVDVIPPSLAIAQAATESAWGKSRFAKEANNYYGQACFVSGCGIVPKRRAAGSKREVKKFNSVNESVASYINNLNTHQAYEHLRKIRYQTRNQQQQLDGMKLSKGLNRYAETGQQYVNSIDRLINKYELIKLDQHFI